MSNWLGLGLRRGEKDHTNCLNLQRRVDCDDSGQFAVSFVAVGVSSSTTCSMWRKIKVRYIDKCAHGKVYLLIVYKKEEKKEVQRGMLTNSSTRLSFHRYYLMGKQIQ